MTRRFTSRYCALQYLLTHNLFDERPCDLDVRRRARAFMRP